MASEKIYPVSNGNRGNDPQASIVLNSQSITEEREVEKWDCISQVVMKEVPTKITDLNSQTLVQQSESLHGIDIRGPKSLCKPMGGLSLSEWNWKREWMWLGLYGWEKGRD